MSRTIEFKRPAGWYQRLALLAGPPEREQTLHYAAHFERLAERYQAEDADKAGVNAFRTYNEGA